MNTQTDIHLNPAKPRREIWPIAIVLAFAFFISFILGAVWLMTTNKSELISEDYYQQELGYQNRIDQEARAVNMGKEVVFSKSESGSEMVFSFKTEKGMETGVTGTINWIRPSDSRMDFKVPFHLSGNKTIIVPIEKIANGFWNLEIEWKEGQNEFYQTEEIRI